MWSQGYNPRLAKLRFAAASNSLIGYLMWMRSAGFAPKRSWSTTFQMRSPRYTTRLDEVPVVAEA
ncbi:DUF4113 domain-containing protein [Methylobacterium sp. SD274]|nr:DUF4113 domain-containing protein [Methylobacterium sp. SD274]